MKGLVFITMPEMMEQMDVSDRTIYEMIERGDLPNFSYGSKCSKKKGWHTAVLEQHALQKYQQSQSIQNTRHITQVGAEAVGITLFRGRDRSMSKHFTHLDNRNPVQQKLSGKKVS